MSAPTISRSTSTPNSHRAHVEALIGDYHRAVDTIMTNRYGPDWATSGELPDEAYTTEADFHRWLEDLLDHIDRAAQPDQ